MPDFDPRLLPTTAPPGPGYIWNPETQQWVKPDPTVKAPLPTGPTGGPGRGATEQLDGKVNTPTSSPTGTTAWTPGGTGAGGGYAPNPRGTPGGPPAAGGGQFPDPAPPPPPKPPVPPSGRDPAADSAAARELRTQLLAERDAAAAGGRGAALVGEQTPISGAWVEENNQIGTPTIAGTSAIAAPTVDAPTINPIERYGSAQVVKGQDAVAGQVAKGPQDQIRARQESYITALEDAAAGKAPSAAELQLQKGNAAAVADQMAMAAGVHGYGGLAAQQQAGRNVAKVQSAGALDAALLRATEMKDARGQLGQALGETRGQDISIGTTDATLGTNVSISNADREAARNLKQADLDQAAAAGNAAAQNEKQRRDAEMKLAADTTTAGLGVDVAKANQSTEATKNLSQAELDLKAQTANATQELQRNLALAGFSQQAILQMSAQELQRQLANAGFNLTQEQIDDLRAKVTTDASLTAQGQMLNFDTQENQQQTQKEITRMELQAQYDRAKAANDTNQMNAIISFAATAGVALVTALSDKREKKKIHKESQGDLDDFLSALESYNYEYKDKANGEGRRSGPMAQELERSLIGRSTVRTDEKGRKGVDTAALTMALAGAVARIRKEQRRAKGGR